MTPLLVIQFRVLLTASRIEVLQSSPAYLLSMSIRNNTKCEECSRIDVAEGLTFRAVGDFIY